MYVNAKVVNAHLEALVSNKNVLILLSQNVLGEFGWKKKQTKKQNYKVLHEQYFSKLKSSHSKKYEPSKRTLTVWPFVINF